MLDGKVGAYFCNPRKISAVDTDESYNLILTFDNGEVRLYSMENELEGVFSVLRNKDKFRTAFLDEFGNVAWDIDERIDSSVEWNNRIDLCKDALYMDSILMSK